MLIMNLRISYINSDKKFIDSYLKLFKNYEVYDCKNDISKLEKVNDKKINKKLLNAYAKFKYLYDNAGLIIDGNFDFIGNISIYFNQEFFIGYKDYNNISDNLIWCKNKNDEYVLKIIKLIESGKYDNLTDVFSALTDKDVSHNYNNIVVFDKKLYIYPYDYFYPIDYEHCYKDFTENLKAIYYDSNIKLSRKNIMKIKLLKKYGVTAYKYLAILLRTSKSNIGYKIYLFKQHAKQKISVKKDLNIDNTLKVLDQYKSKIENGEKLDYIIMHNPRWLGVTSSTKEMFTNLVPLEELYLDKNIEIIAQRIINLGVSQVIFSAFDFGWDKLSRRLKQINKNLKIKVFWHGSNSQVIEDINWTTNVMVINLHKEGIIDAIATCKQSLLNFYKSQGYNATFIMNTVNLPDQLYQKIAEEKKKNSVKNNDQNIKVGLYSAGVDWRKNTYNQVMATSLFKNATMELVPLRHEIQKTATYNDLKVVGNNTHVKREELLLKMCRNDINLYVTFSECSPMLPLESMEAGTVCISGNNHHYFNNTELYDYLVVEREDDVISIYEKMKYALENKYKILDLYKKWKKDYDILCRKSVEDFLNM